MATYNLSKSEYLALSSAISGGKLKMSSLFLAFIGLVMTGGWFFLDDAPIHNIIFGPLLLILLVSIPLFLRLKLGKTYDQQKSHREDITLELKKDAIHSTQVSGSRTLPWESIIKWNERGNFILLYENSLVPSMIIPLSALSPEESSFLREKLD